MILLSKTDNSGLFWYAAEFRRGTIRPMPTIFIGGYKFRFYATDEHEPPHIHVLRGGSVAKIWLTDVTVEYNRGYNQRELNRIVELTRAHKARLLEAWNDYFSQ